MHRFILNFAGVFLKSDFCSHPIKGKRRGGFKHLKQHLKLVICVSVCVREREREREMEWGDGTVYGEMAANAMLRSNSRGNMSNTPIFAQGAQQCTQTGSEVQEVGNQTPGNEGRRG